jgi:LysR family hydrogen peroxide-inducible transcriptional activator
MTLQELRYIVALADVGHFARAAATCHISQSTLSIQIKKLEKYLGVTLFDRSQRHVAPTPVGKQIIARARSVLEEVAGIRDVAAAEQDPMAGTLMLGIIPTLGPYLLPHLLPVIHQTFPKLKPLLREDFTEHLLEQLHVGRLDALLLALPVPPEGLSVESLFEEPFEVAMPKQHPLAAKRRVRRKELFAHTVLLLEEGHCLRDQALEFCRKARSDQREEVKATSLETLRQMVALGIGCTLLPALAVKGTVGLANNGMITTRRFAGPAPSREIGLVWRQRFAREEALVRLAELVRANLPPGVKPVRRFRGATGTAGYPRPRAPIRKAPAALLAELNL